MRRPVLFYIDHNEDSFENIKDLLGSPQYQVKFFSDPLQALRAIPVDEPELVLTAQILPGMSGCELLRLVKKSYPHTKRLILLDEKVQEIYSLLINENLCDFVLEKPLHPLNLKLQVHNLISKYKTERQNRNMLRMVQESREELEAKNKELSMLIIKEKMAQKELQCWMHPVVDESVSKGHRIPNILSFAGICFDIIDSSQKRRLALDGKSVRHVVLEKFVEKLMEHGGWQESQGGDSAYGYFKAENIKDACQLALVAALDFRRAINELNQLYSQDIRISIGLHHIPRARLKVVQAEAKRNGRKQKQKCFVTFSEDIDLLHRLEKVGHQRDSRFGGTPVLMTRQFVSQLPHRPGGLLNVGQHDLTGIRSPVDVFLLRDKLLSYFQAPTG